MAWYTTLIGNLSRLGFYDFILPWLFAFAVIYGLLVKSKVIADEKKPGVNGLIAIVIAFFLTAYTPYGTTLGVWFTEVFGMGVLFIAILLIIVLFAAIFGITEFKTENLKGYVPILAILLLIWLFWTGWIGVSGAVPIGISAGELTATLFVVAVFIIAIWFVTWEKGSKSD